MNIINISSSIEITPAQISFCEELCLYVDNKNTDIDSYYQLSKKIPIFLVNAFEGEKGEGDKPSTDWLGYYKRSSCSPFDNTPTIVICPERIAECVSSKDEFTWLFAKVLIHELSHARLDVNNENILYVHTSVDPFFYKWMEESIANMMTLRVFEEIVQRADWYRNAFDYIKEFIAHQPIEYKFGGWLYANVSFDGLVWREVKHNISLNDSEKRLWINYQSQVNKIFSAYINYPRYKYQMIKELEVMNERFSFIDMSSIKNKNWTQKSCVIECENDGIEYIFGFDYRDKIWYCTVYTNDSTWAEKNKDDNFKDIKLKHGSLVEKSDIAPNNIIRAIYKKFSIDIPFTRWKDIERDIKENL